MKAKNETVMAATEATTSLLRAGMEIADFAVTLHGRGLQHVGDGGGRGDHGYQQPFHDAAPERCGAVRATRATPAIINNMPAQRQREISSCRNNLPAKADST